VGKYAAKITQLVKLGPTVYPKSLNRTLSTQHFWNHLKKHIDETRHQLINQVINRLIGAMGINCPMVTALNAPFSIKGWDDKK
jgi:hypothetical protein